MMKIFVFLSFVFILNACNEGVYLPPLEGSEKYLVVRPVGGLANRLRVLASASVMAKTTHRTLVLDWEIDSHSMAAKFSDLFQNKILSVSDIGGLENYRKGKVYSDDGNGDRIYAEFTRIPLDDSRVVYIYTCFNFFPDTISFDKFLGEYKFFYDSLKPVKEIEEKIAQQVKQFSSPENMIGVHYRTWTTSTDLGYTFLEKPELKAFKEKIDEIVVGSNRIFLASDDSEVQTSFKDIRAQKIFSENSNMRRDTLVSQQEALVDWLLLGKTNVIIGTYQSSFSDEAALMTQTGKKYNVGPQIYDFTSVICFDDNGTPYQRPAGRKVRC